MELIVAGVAGLIGFVIGRAVTKYPSEMEMMNQLILAQAERRRSSWDNERIKSEISEAAEELARKMSRSA